jgi:hypothetical protein
VIGREGTHLGIGKLHKNYIKEYGTQPETLTGIYFYLASACDKLRSPFLLTIEIKSTHVTSVATRTNLSAMA